MSVLYRKTLVGEELEVLFEEEDGGYFTGHAPNYVKIYAKGENLHNKIQKVSVSELWKDGVLGIITKNQA